MWNLRRKRAWWRHQMETFSALLVLYAGNSPVTGEFPAQRPVTRSFDVFFDLRLNKRLSKQSWGWWFETPSCPLWRHCNGLGFQGGAYAVPVLLQCLRDVISYQCRNSVVVGCLILMYNSGICESFPSKITTRRQHQQKAKPCKYSWCYLNILYIPQNMRKDDELLWLVMVRIDHLSSLQWRHNGRDGVSNHQPHDCLLNHLLRRRSKKTSKLRFKADSRPNQVRQNTELHGVGRYIPESKPTSARHISNPNRM